MGVRLTDPSVAHVERQIRLDSAVPWRRIDHDLRGFPGGRPGAPQAKPGPARVLGMAARMNARSAIIWDFDGTLAQRRGLWSQCLADIANESLGVGLSREQFVPFLRSGFPWHTPEVSHPNLTTSEDWWTALAPLFASAFAGATGVDSRVARELAAQVRHRYIDPRAWTVFSEVRAVLARLSSQGWVHVMLSNHVPELPALVTGLGLVGHFEAILSSANIGFEKPRTECFEAALARLPSDAKRVVVVGDSYSADIVGAESAGLEGLLVRAEPREACRRFDNLELVADYLSEG